MSDLRDKLFTYRSYTPIPFLVVGLALGQPTVVSLVLGFLLAILGESIRFWGVGHATSETRVTGSVGASRLIVSGPFGYLRNPLYLGNIMLYTGFGVMANLWWLILLSLAWFIFQYAMIISREEEFLSGRFGEEYARYRAAVRRFIPRIRPYTDGAAMRIMWNVAIRSEQRTFQALLIGIVLMVAKWAWMARTR